MTHDLSDPAASPRPSFRFAPSPNGPLHLGHAYSALLNDRLARQAGGRLLLRLEDIDRQRCSDAHAEAVMADLAWLGLAWEEPVRRQSQHFPLYALALQSLAGRGLAYPCFCTRGSVLQALAGRVDGPRDPDGTPLYPGLCRALGPAERRLRIDRGHPHAWRLDMRAALSGVEDLDWLEQAETRAPGRRMVAEPARWGDAIIARKDVPTSYHLSVVVDDAAQGITDVVRGTDLLAATALHRLLQTLLGLPAPRYHHHRLIVDAAGQKLSKSRGATGLRTLREGGLEPESLRRQLGFD